MNYERNSIKYERICLYVTPDYIKSCVHIEGSLYILSPEMVGFLLAEVEKQPEPVEVTEELSRPLRRHAEKILRRLYPAKTAEANCA